MNFDFSDDQKLLRDQARKFLTDKCDRTVVRSVLEDSQKNHSDDLWKEISTMGWTGTAIPEEYGGLGLGMLELCVIAEELGRSLAPTPFSSSIYLFAEFIKLYGTEDQKKKYLPEIASGEAIGSFALSEGNGKLFKKFLNVLQFYLPLSRWVELKLHLMKQKNIPWKDMHLENKLEHFKHSNTKWPICMSKLN